MRQLFSFFLFFGFASSLMGAAGGGGGGSAADLSMTRPDYNVFWDDFSGRNIISGTNLGVSPSGHQWHLYTAQASNQMAFSNGFWRGASVNNSQDAMYAAISNTVSTLEWNRWGGKLRPLSSANPFDLHAVGGFILTDQWPSFTTDPNFLHVGVYDTLLHFEKSLTGTQMFQLNYPIALPKDTTHVFEFQVVSNTCWYQVGPYRGTFTHPDLYLYVNKDYQIWENYPATTNTITPQWDAAWAGYAYPDLKPVDGTLFTDFRSFTNHSTVGAFTNFMSYTNTSNTLANNGDRITGLWRGNFATGTNQIQIGYGSATNALDSGAVTNLGLKSWEAYIEITKTGATSQHVDGYIRWDQGGGVPFTSTNFNKEIAETNALSTKLFMAGQSIGLGKITNNFLKVRREPNGP